MLLKLETAWKRATSFLLKTSSFVSHWFGTTWKCHFHSRTKQVFDSKSNETYMGELKHVYCCTMSIVFSSDGPVTALPNPFKASVGLLSSC